MLGTKNQYSGYMNVNKNISRRHSIFRLELQLALDFFGAVVVGAGGAVVVVVFVIVVVVIVVVIGGGGGAIVIRPIQRRPATVLRNDNFPWSLATMCVHAWLCTRGASCL